MRAIGVFVLSGLAAMSVGAQVARQGSSPMTLTLLVADSPRAAELESFVAEHVFETWKVEPSRQPSPPGGDAAVGQFRVAIAWPAQGRMIVRIEEGGLELAYRELSVSDAGAAKLTVWLLIKSTINRALVASAAPVAVQRAAPEAGVSASRTAVGRQPSKQPESAAGVSASRTAIGRQPSKQPETGEPQSVSTAALGHQPSKDPETAESEPGPASAESPAAGLAEPQAEVHARAQRALENERRAWEINASLHAAMGRPSLFAVGPSFGVWLRLENELLLSGEVGYRLSPRLANERGKAGLVVHHLPVTAALAWERGGLALGGLAVCDVKVPVSRARTELSLGMEIGVLAQIHVPPAAAPAHWVMRASAALRPVRQRYRLAAKSVTEAPYVFGIATGVSWQ